ncbi:hypothetical protein SASPL_138888 [Salvia splendens]|uniref:Uncharacterized protein n=1 Tax=Salvia splendens TaxID=180675 RepID=A0A8X8WWD2_SALSN|nr:uncharacterized protein LOC121764615 [Salvia splendens]KAG6402019.1 hypothetical protein SASPL_138888 [Salvia splendens]
MEAAVSHPRATYHHFSTFSPKIGAFRPNALPLTVRINQRSNLKVMKCAKADSVPAAEQRLVLGNEEVSDMEEELRKLNGKCGGIGGIVELMECLEREAIMGDDEGREPTDYNRRALIFDRSSRVFQALKQQSQTLDTTSA